MKLLDQVRCAIRRKHYSTRTEKVYVEWIRRYIIYHKKRHPKDMGESEISQYLSFLAVKGHVAAGTQNQALNAIVFLYKHVLGKELGDFGPTVRAKRPQRLPNVLSKQEVAAVLQNLTGQHLLMTQLLCGCGLRLTECIHLRVKDIDFDSHRENSYFTLPSPSTDEAGAASLPSREGSKKTNMITTHMKEKRTTSNPNFSPQSNSITKCGVLGPGR